MPRAKAARKTARKTARKAPQQTPEPTNPYDEPQDADGSGNLFDRMDEDSYANVKRLDDTTKQWVYQFRLAPHECYEEILQQYRGGGTYRLQEQKRDKDTGRFHFGRQRTVTIDGPLKPLTELPPGVTQAPGDGGKPGPLASDSTELMRAGTTFDDAALAGIINLMNAQQGVSTMQSKMFEVMMAKVAMQRDTDWPAVIAGLVPIVTEVIKRPAPEQPDPVAMVAQVAQVFKENTSPATGLKEQLGLIDKLLDVKGKATDMATPDMPPPADPVDALFQQLPKLVQMMQDDQKIKLRERGFPVDEIERAETPLVADASPTADAAAPFPPPPAGAAPQEPEGPAWQVAFKSRVKFLLSLAQQNADPVDMGRAEYHLIPMHLRGAIGEFMGQPNAFEQIMAVLPELHPFSGWAGQFFEALYFQFFPEDEPEEIPVEEEDEGEEVGKTPSIPSQATATEATEVRDGG